MQFSVWHRSDIRQACGVTRWPESPEVKALDGRGNLPRVWPAREASKQEGRSESERTSRRKEPPARSWFKRVIGVPRVCCLYPMASAGAEELRPARTGLPAEAEGGNPGQYSSESPEGEEDGQDDPVNVKARSYNRRCREMERSSPDWRMRSPSDDGRDNRTRSERGPLGSGGDDTAGGPHAVAEFPCGGRGRLRNGVNAGTVRGYGGVGLNLDGPAEGSAPNCEVPDA